MVPNHVLVLWLQLFSTKFKSPRLQKKNLHELCFKVGQFTSVMVAPLDLKTANVAPIGIVIKAVVAINHPNTTQNWSLTIYLQNYK